MPSQPKLVLLGRNGRLGRALVKQIGDKYESVAVGREECDITCRDVVGDLLGRVRPDVVINATGYTNVDACEANREAAFQINVEGNRNVAETCRSIGCRFVCFSTDYVFDGESEIPYVESDPVKPINVYGESKLEGERVVKELCANHIILRTSWLYGEAGDDFVSWISRQAHEMIKARKEGRDVSPLKVIDDQFGNPTWTRDVAIQTEQLLTSEITGVVHASAEGETSWLNFAQELMTILDINVSVEPCRAGDLKRPARRPGRSSLENKRLKEAGCDAMPAWRQSLKQFLGQANGVGKL